MEERLNNAIIEREERNAEQALNIVKAYDLGSRYEISKREDYYYYPLKLVITIEVTVYMDSHDRLDKCKEELESTLIDGKKYIYVRTKWIPYEIGHIVTIEEKTEELTKINNFNGVILLLFCQEGKTIPDTVKTVFDVLIKRQNDWVGKVQLYYDEYWNTDYGVPVYEIENYIKFIESAVTEQFGLKELENEFKWHGGLYIYYKKKFIHEGFSENFEENIDNLLNNKKTDFREYLVDKKPYDEYKNNKSIIMNFLYQVKDLIADDNLYDHNENPISLTFFSTLSDLYNKDSYYEKMNIIWYLSFKEKQIALKFLDYKHKLESKIGYKIRSEVYCHFDYRQRGYLGPIEHCLCSICNINEINQTEYMVCYLCSMHDKHFYVCPSCFKYIINEGGRCLHEHPLLYVHPDCVNLLDSIPHFPSVHRYSALDEIEYENYYSCSMCWNRGDNYWYFWKCCNCERFELCSQCFKEYIEDKDNKKREHNRTHCFIRIRKHWSLSNKECYI